MIKRTHMARKAIFTLLLSGLPFIANMALAVENQITGLNNDAIISSDEEPVDLNTATAEQFMTLKGVGKKKAEAIIHYRQQHGGFRSIEELDAVKGIGPKLLAANLARLTIHSAPAQSLNNQEPFIPIPLDKTPLLTPE